MLLLQFSDDIGICTQVFFHASNKLLFSTTVVVDHLDLDLPLRDASEHRSNPRNMRWIMQTVRPPPGNMS